VRGEAILAVDLGKTSCRAMLWAGDTATTGAGTGAPGLAAPGGLLAAEAAILAVAGSLLRAAGLPCVGVASIGAAGALAGPDLAAALASRLAVALPAGEVLVTSDAVMAHAGAFAGGPGVVLAIGTGSVALSLDASGWRRADGWGPLLGDEGSGGWIGARGLRAACRAGEGRGPATQLAAAAAARFGGLDRVPAQVATATAAARFAPDVARVAEAGDIVAIAILRRAAEHLAATARSAAPPGARCAVIGGLAQMSPLLSAMLEALLREAGLQPVPPLGTALDGARLLVLERGLPHALHATRCTAPRGDRLDQLATERVRPGLDDLDQRSPSEVARLVLEAEFGAREALLRAADQVALAADAVAARLLAGGRLFYVGAGTPGRLAVLDAAELGPTFSAPDGLVIPVMAGGPDALRHAMEGAEDDPDAAGTMLAAHGLRADDAVVGIAASGRTPFVVGGLRYARACGALTIGLVNNPASPAVAAAEFAIEVLTGPEPIAGSTRMLAGTSQKIVLNALSTSAMVALGKTFGNRMVDVRATNAKLRRRAARIVREITEASEAEAASALAASGGRVKPAVVALLARTDVAEAERLLARSGGRVREALRVWESSK